MFRHRARPEPRSSLISLPFLRQRLLKSRRDCFAPLQNNRQVAVRQRKWLEFLSRVSYVRISETPAVLLMPLSIATRPYLL
jgi:hypothetical protein